MSKLSSSNTSQPDLFDVSDYYDPLNIDPFQIQASADTSRNKYLSIIGFIPAVFVFFPLPYRDPGQRFSKTIRAYRLDLSSGIGCPFGKAGRAVLSLITTQAVRTKSPLIELGTIADTFRRLDLSPTGGKTGSIGRVTAQFHRISNMHVDMKHLLNVEQVKGIQEVHFSFARSLSLYWTQKDQPRPLPPSFQNNLELSAECFEYIISHSVPTLLEAYFSIQSPREQDLFTWLGRRLWNLPDERLIKWNSLYEQFGPVTTTYKPLFRKEIAGYLLDIQVNHYPAARMKLTDEGLVLRKSPPLVEPGDKRAGYLS